MGELRSALRMLLRMPHPLQVMTALLALGMGLSTMLFGIVDVIMLRPLPVPYPETLVRMIQ